MASRAASSTSDSDPSDSSAREETDFLARLGERVRHLRGGRSLSRKALAGRAGVSERYLAQLESGRGNISVLLLRRVGEALGQDLIDLLPETQSDAQLDAREDRDLAALIAQLRVASEEARGRVRAALDDHQSLEARVAGIALIGLRGAGKSTLGSLLAKDLGLPFVELNDRISAASGLAVAEIFNLYGPEGYRRLERQCLQEIIEREPRVVLASGGGIVSDPGTYELLLKSFFSVWLRAAPEEHMARVRAQGDLRPMAGNSKAMRDLRLILETRETLYARADRQFETSGRSLEACRNGLASLVRKNVEAGPAST